MQSDSAQGWFSHTEATYSNISPLPFYLPFCGRPLLFPDIFSCLLLPASVSKCINTFLSKAYVYAHRVKREGQLKRSNIAPGISPLYLILSFPSSSTISPPPLLFIQYRQDRWSDRPTFVTYPPSLYYGQVFFGATFRRPPGGCR